MKEVIEHLERMAETLDGVTEDNWADTPADIASIYRSVADEIRRKSVVVAKMETTAQTCKDSLQVQSVNRDSNDDRIVTGNAAKMRKALEEISSAYGKWLYGKDDRHSDDILQKCRNIADDALSAPPRKCDLYSNSKDAHEGYKRYEQDFFLRSNSIFDNPLSLATWLFAEAEGSAK